MLCITDREKSRISLTYQKTVLHACEVVPETSRQRFKAHKKTDRQTFVEFARDQLCQLKTYFYYKISKVKSSINRK